MNQTLNLSKEKERFRDGLTNANKISNYPREKNLIQLNDQNSVILGYPSISNLSRRT